MQRNNMAGSDDDSNSEIEEEEVAKPSVNLFSGYNFVRATESTPINDASTYNMLYVGRGMLAKPNYSDMQVNADGMTTTQGSSKSVLYQVEENPCLPASFRSIQWLASPGLFESNFPLSRFGTKNLPNLELRCMAEESVPCVAADGKIGTRRQAKYYLAVTNARPTVSGGSSRRSSNKRASHGSLKENQYESLGYYVIELHVRYIKNINDKFSSHSKLLASIKFTPDRTVTVSPNNVSVSTQKICIACHLLRDAEEFTANQHKKDDGTCMDCQASIKKATKPIAPSGTQYAASSLKTVKKYAPKTSDKLKAVVINNGDDETGSFRLSTVQQLHMETKDVSMDLSSSHLDLHRNAGVMDWLIGLAQATSTVIDVTKSKSAIVASYNRDLIAWRNKSISNVKTKTKKRLVYPPLAVNYERVLEEDLHASHISHVIVFESEVLPDVLDNRSYGSVRIDGQPNTSPRDAFGLDWRRLYCCSTDGVNQQERLWNATEDSHPVMDVDDVASTPNQLTITLKVELARQSKQLAELCCSTELNQSDYDKYRNKDRIYRFLLEQFVASRVIGKEDWSAPTTPIPKGKGESRKAYRALVNKMKTEKATIVEELKEKVCKRLESEDSNLKYYLRKLQRCIDSDSTICNELSRLVLDGTAISVSDSSCSNPSTYSCQSPSFRLCCAWCKQDIVDASTNDELQIALSQAMGAHIIFECKDVPYKKALTLSESLERHDRGSFMSLHNLAIDLHAALKFQMNYLVTNIGEQVDIALTRSLQLTAHANRSIQYKRRPRPTKIAQTDSSMTSEELAADQALRSHWTDIKLVDTEHPDETTRLECYQDPDAKHFWNDPKWKSFYVGRLDNDDNNLFVVDDWLPASSAFVEELDLSNLPKNQWYAITPSLREKLVYSADDYAKVLEVYPREVCKAGKKKLFRVTFSADWIEIHTIQSFQQLPKANLRDAERQNAFNDLLESMNAATLGSDAISVPDELKMGLDDEDGEGSAPVLLSAMGYLDAYRLQNAHEEVEYATLDVLKESIQPANHPDVQHFFRSLQASKEDEWILVPKGSRGNFFAGQHDDFGLADGPPLPYRYSSITNLCAFGAAANVLALAGDVEGGDKLWAAANMTIDQLENILRISGNKGRGRYELVVAYLRQELKYVVQKLPHNYDALAQSESAKLVEIVSNNGRCAHVVGIVGNAILDGNRGFELQLSKAALDWCAGSSSAQDAVSFVKAMGYSLTPSKKTLKAIRRKNSESLFAKNAVQC